MKTLSAAVPSFILVLDMIHLILERQWNGCCYRFDIIILCRFLCENVFHHGAESFFLPELLLIVFPFEAMQEIILLMQVEGDRLTCEPFYFLGHWLLAVDSQFEIPLQRLNLVESLISIHHFILQLSHLQMLSYLACMAHLCWVFGIEFFENSLLQFVQTFESEVGYLMCSLSLFFNLFVYDLITLSNFMPVKFVESDHLLSIDR